MTNKNLPSLPTGTVVWRMRGHFDNSDYRKADKVFWWAKPVSIERTDAHGIYRTSDGGFSKNSIGKNYFLTRDEAIADFLENTAKNAQLQPDGSYMTENTHKSEENEPKPEPKRLGNIIDPNKAIWDSLVTVLHDHKTVYALDLEKTDPKSGIAYITLKDIREKYPTGILTVIAEHPLRGEIYQIGNYPAKNGSEEWQLHGTTLGYA